MPHIYDIAILGASAGGYAAACRLAAAKRDVVVIDAPLESVTCPLADWVPADFFKLPALPKALARTVRNISFSSIVYHSTDLDRQAEHKSRRIAGYFFQASALVKALGSLAVAGGAKVRSSATFPAIRLQEDGVLLMGTTQVAAKLLIVAQNRPEDIISDLALPVRSVPQSPIVAAALEVPLPPKSARPGFNSSLHIVQSPHKGELGMFFVCGPVVHLRIIRSSSGARQYVADLSNMVAKLQQAGRLPPDLSLRKARGAVWHPPAGVALELDTHVAKRCILTGTAGGFADSITGATLSASVHSALLAAKAADEALDSSDIQDALMGYMTSWRETLAESLRPPNTSLAMLMPLIFVNPRIAAKFSDALLHGQSI
jgi:flavin-dependent dehydrogenase